VRADVDGRGTATFPVRLLDVDLYDPLSEHWTADPRYVRAGVLLRRRTETVGVVEVETPEGVLTRDALLHTVEQELPGALIHDPERAQERAEIRQLVRATAPRASVILCTRGRPQYLPACLASLVAIDYPDFEVVVVDNGAPEDDVDGLVASFEDSRLRVLREPKPGLSFARNTGLRAAEGSFVAFTDDDAIVDPDWLIALWEAIETQPGAAVATGLVLPAELETQAQVWFEEFGGHSKGRAFARQIVDPMSPDCQHPLYPLPAFGAGVNMGFRIEALEEIGGFDPALGAGSPAGGSEDTAVFSQVLLRGHALVYTPDAVVRHYHRPDVAALERQLAGYGRGLTAYYTKLVLDRPRLLWELGKLAPTAVRDLLSDSSVRNSGLGDDFPREFTRAQVRGMLQGPLAYLRGRHAVRSKGFTR
jgi:glycosyltransferase involved in cell wall biosynthesis